MQNIFFVSRLNDKTVKGKKIKFIKLLNLLLSRAYY